MSIIANLLKQKQAQSGFLVAIGGERLAGKSTIAGTAPGKTLVIQPAGIEAGNTSPVALAKSRGNQLDMVQFDDHLQIFDILKDPALKGYDNIVIDGISAFTELVYNSAQFKEKSKKNKWDGFDYVKDMSTDLVTAAKELAEGGNKNVFITYALKKKVDANGNTVDLEMVAKGNATKDLIEGKCPNVLAVVAIEDDKGVLNRRLVTRNVGPYVARLGNILDADNPKSMEADLDKLLKFVKRG